MPCRLPNERNRPSSRSLSATHHPLLPRPPQAVPNVEDLAEHRFSPAVCDAVRDGREMFWATTEAGEGLLGRSDLQLKTAVP